MNSMKRLIIMTATALLISAGIAAQTTDPVQNQTKTRNKEQNKEQTMTKTKKANHGQTVSETARNTESGEGKGEIVSEQAKLQGETRQARIKNQTSAKNQTGNTGARPANAMQQNKVNAAKG